jgi:hypothetical protein
MPTFLEQLVGRKPNVPEVPSVSLPEEQQKAVAANLAVAPEAAKLATFSQDQINRMMEMAIPGFAGMRGQVSTNINALLRGEIPLDVSDEVKRQGAGRALTGGYAGSGAADNLVARDLGLTSLGLTKQGLSSAESWIGAMEQLFSPSQALFTGMFITPQQQFAAATQERDLQFQRNWLQEQISAMPAPWAEDFKQFVYRAMSAYSGTPVKDNPYSTPGSFSGGGGGPGGGGGGGNGINWGGSDWGSNPTTDKPFDWTRFAAGGY